MLVASENFYFDEIGATEPHVNSDQPEGAKLAPVAGVTNLGTPMQMYARA